MKDVRLDAIGKLLAGVGTAYVDVEMLPGEKRLHQVVADRGNIARGLLIRTRSRPVFTPWKVADPLMVPSCSVPKLGGPEIETHSAVGRGRGLLAPPTLIATRADSGHLEFGVLSDRLSPNIARSNEVARDEFVSAIKRSC